MTIHFAATSIADFELEGGALATDSYTTASGLAPYVLEGVALEDNRIVARDLVTPITGSFWGTNYGRTPTSSFGSDVYLYLYDSGYSTSQPVFRVWSDIGSGSTGWTGPIRIDGWNGSTWVNLVTSGAGGGTALTRFDYNIVRDTDGTDGEAAVYINGALSGSRATGLDTTLVAWTSIDRVEWFLDPTSGSDTWVFSAFILSDEDTTPMIFVQEVPTADGTNTDFTGAYTTIDELGRSDADFITSSTPGDRSTFTGSIDAVIDSGHDILASVITANVRNVGGSGINMAGTRYISATNYDGSSLAIPAAGIGVVMDIAEVDPSTAVAWTPSGIEAIEFGVKYVS